MFPARPAPETLLKPSEAARLLGVRPTTLASWARAGRLTAQVTPGGHRRYRAADIYAIIEASGGTDADAWKDDAVRLYEQGWSIRQISNGLIWVTLSCLVHSGAVMSAQVNPSFGGPPTGSLSGSLGSVRVRSAPSE